MSCGIYAIINTLTNDEYIGQSVNIKGRIRNHFILLNNNTHCNSHLQHAFNKYGAENFGYAIILYCEPDELTYYEQKCVDIWNPRYNIHRECVDSPKGTKLSVETRKKISTSNKGHYVSLETKAKIATKLKGHTISNEVRLRISATNKGRPSGRKGCKFSAEHKAKMSESQIKHRNSES